MEQKWITDRLPECEVEGCWEEDVIYTICQSEEYQESMIFKM